MLRSVVIGTGSYIPTVIQSNSDFNKQDFYSDVNVQLTISSDQVLEKFKQITGIAERRYVEENFNASDIAAIAARNAIEDSGIDPETLDQIIVAHNFGDVTNNAIQSDAVPSLANRVKHVLGIRKPECIAYDLLFGCPGWVQAMIQTDAYFKAGMAERALVIGTETLSRVIDKYDRDSMLFADGAGACVMEKQEVSDKGPGILSSCAMSHSLDESSYINLGKSYHPETDPDVRYLKMKGRKVYEYAVKYVPAAMKQCLDKSGVGIHELKKIFIHQANEKMDEAMLTRFYQLYGMDKAAENVMPMCIQWLGNSSVATIPTLLDLVRRNKMENHTLSPGDVLLFASVGAGMNINAICYRY